MEEQERARSELAISAEQINLLSDIFRLFYVFQMNSLLYPAGSQMLTEPTERLFEKVSLILSKVENLELLEVRGEILANRARLNIPESKKNFEKGFVSIMERNNLERISFQRGLTKEELGFFLENISKKEESGNLIEALKSRNIEHIKVAEVNLEIAMSKPSKERERLEEIMLMDYLLSRISGMSDSQVNIAEELEVHADEMASGISQISSMVGETKEGTTANRSEVIAKSIQKIGAKILETNPDEWPKYKKSLAKVVMLLEPQLRREVLLAKCVCEEQPGKKNLIQEIIQELPADIVRDLAKVESEKDKSPKEQIDRSAVSEEPEGISLEEKVEKILNLPEEDFLKIEIQSRIKSVLHELVTKEKFEFVQKILAKLISFLNIQTQEVRDAAARYLADLTVLLHDLNNQQILDKLIDGQLKNLETQKDLKVFSQITKNLANLLADAIDNKEFTLAGKLIDKFIYYIESPKSSTEYKTYLKEALAKISLPVRSRLLVEEIIKRSEANSDYSEILNLIKGLGPHLIKPLIEEAMMEDKKTVDTLGYFAAFTRRRIIGNILKELDKQNVIAEIKDKFHDERWFVVRNTLELFVYLKDKEFIDLIEIALRHPNAYVRRKAVFVLNKIGTKEVIALLFLALDDEDMSVKLNTIRYLSAIADVTAIDKLSVLTKNKNEEIRKAAQEAIEQIKKKG